MNHWDDYRYVLAVARYASLNKAAGFLAVNRSTVLRRITALEIRLGVRLFERLPNGYFTTPAGDEMVAAADKMETLSNDVDRHLAGRDKTLSGTIRVSLSGVLATTILMPEFARFSSLHSDIKLEILTTYDMPDLTRREADVAIRISNDPPEYLVGRKLLKVARATYIGKGFQDADMLPALNWIGWSVGANSSQWVEESADPEKPIGVVITDPYATVAALKHGMGMSVLPCYFADQDKDLCRVSPDELLWSTDLWVLTHKDLRGTARIRIFTQFITEALLKYSELFEGQGVNKS